MQQNNDNQLVQAIEDWKEMENKAATLFSKDVWNQKAFLRQKLKTLKHIVQEHKRESHHQDKIIRMLLKAEIKKLEQYLYPNLLTRLMVKVAAFTVRFIKENLLTHVPPPKPLLQKIRNTFHQIKKEIMDTKNLEYLQNNLKYLGFNTVMNQALAKNMEEGKSEFQLRFVTEINKKPFEAALNFKKSETTNMYFFNNYQASLERANGEKIAQTFYLNKGKGITAKEAYNLLDGRAVHKDLATKEGVPYKAWLQLDLENKGQNNNFEVKQYHEKYGFDVKEALSKFAVAELKDPQREKDLVQSLQKGNLQSVTIEKDGHSHKMFMEADPKYKNVKLYDSQMKLVTKEAVSQYQSAGHHTLSKSIKEEVIKDRKKEVKQEVKAAKQKGENKTTNSLLPKKRESTKKGLGIA